jgi:hypothetical protein
MATDRTVYVFEGDATNLINALKQVDKSLKVVAKDADKTDKKIDKLGEASKKSGKKVSTLGRDLGKLGGKLKGGMVAAGMLAAGILAAGAAVLKFSQHMADTQNQLSDMAARTGVSTKTLAGLKLAAEGSGQSLDQVAKALKPLVLRMGQVTQGSKTAIDGFKAVGVEVVDASGKLRSADDVLIEVTKSLAAMEDPTERAAAAALAFGSAGTKLVQALGDKDLGVFVDAAERFGMDIGPAAAKAADDWQRATANLSLVTEAFSADLLKFNTGILKDFTLGFVYIKTLLGSLSQTTLPELLRSFYSVFLDVGIFLADIRDHAILGVYEGFVELSKVISKVFGAESYPIVKSMQSVDRATYEAWVELKRLNDEAGTMGKSFDEAWEEARAFFTHTQLAAGKTEKAIADMLEPLEGENWEKLLAGLDFKSWGQMRQEEMDALNEQVDFQPLREQIAENRDLVLDTSADMLANYADTIGNAIEIMADAMGNLTKGQKAALMVLYRVQQGAAISSIYIDTAQAVMKMAASPLLPPPLNIAAAIAMATLGASQAAAVAAAPPPFHVGGIIPGGIIPGPPSGVTVNALGGEGILNRETTARLGREGVEDLNTGGGGGPVVVEMIYKHQIFDAFVSDNIKKGGPLRNAIKSGRRVGHSGGN